MKYSFILFFCSLTMAEAQKTDSIMNEQRLLIHRVDSLVASYKFEKALDILAKGDSMNVEILLRIGQCNFRLGASGSAIHPYERVLQIDSANLSALNQLGQLYARDGDFSKALASFVQLIRLDTANSYYYRQAGSMAARLENKIFAKELYRKALHFNSLDVEASMALGTIMMDMEEYAGVDSIVDRALVADGTYKPLLLLKAKSAFEQQHFETVILTINSLLEKSDTSAIHARLLGISYFHLHNYNKLVTCMNFMLRNRYDNEWIFYYLGVASRELGDIAASIDYFRMAVQKSISENTMTYYSQLGQSYEEMGDYQGAIRSYRAAYNYSKDGILLYHLARTYDVFYKDKTTALAYYQKYLKSDDTIRRAKEYARKRMQDMGLF